jgi:hypothetical protein
MKDVREWSQIIKFNNVLSDEYALIEYFLYLNTESITKEFSKNFVENILLSNKITEFNKNIIVKHLEISTDLRFSDYWKSKSKLNKGFYYCSKHKVNRIFKKMHLIII